MNKKGISAIVGYVLLISITLALSVMVYNWLRFYVSGEEIEACSDKVNIVISDYDCQSKVSGGTNGMLNVTLKNKGLFRVDGYILRVHDEEMRDFGIYTFNDTGKVLNPGEEYSDFYSLDEHLFGGIQLITITLVEVQPFMNDADGNMICQSYTSQKTVC